MKRFLIALLVGGALFAAVFGAAASLTVNGGVIQGGEDTDLVCDDNGIYVWAYGLNTYPVLEGVESVKIKGVSSACNGARIMGRVELTNSDPNDNSTYAYTSGKDPQGVGEYFVIANGDESTVYVLFLKHDDYATQWFVPAEDIVGIKLWIEGETS